MEWTRWIAEVSRQLDLPYSTCWKIARGKITSLSTHTVDKIARKTGIPVSVFYDGEV